ncbi:hypothetical protein ES703_35171 [subsurface metagenome]
MLSFLRFSLANLILIIVYRVQGHKIKIKGLMNAWIVLGGVAIGLSYSLFSIGLQYTSANMSNIIVQSQVICLILLSYVFLKEKIDFLKAVGIAVCLLGIFLVLFQNVSVYSFFQSELLLGNMTIFTAGVCWAFFGLSQKIVLLSQNDILEILILTFIVGSIITGVFATLKFQLPFSFDWQSVISIIVLGMLCTGLSYIFLLKGFQRLSASTVGMTTTTTPLLTLFTARLILGESITCILIGGGAAVVVGIILIVFSERKDLKNWDIF